MNAYPTSNSASMTIRAGSLQRRNIGSIVEIPMGDAGVVVGTLEAYSKHPDGKSVDVMIAGVEAVLLDAEKQVIMCRTSEYNANIAMSKTMQDLVSALIGHSVKGNTFLSNLMDATLDIADTLDPEGAAVAAPATPLTVVQNIQTPALAAS
ncbi:hypothetical protein [Glutamicibacter arilaitensis]|uniref:hypothetical protein n=1 Tax=Glutamicibacter arilaitensis TaxID=256701 RepID=UPI003F8F242A